MHLGQYFLMFHAIGHKGEKKGYTYSSPEFNHSWREVVLYLP